MAKPKLSAAQRFQARAPASQAVEGIGPAGHVVEKVAEPRIAEVHHLGGDALTVHVGQAQDGVVQPVPPRGVRRLVLGMGCQPVLGAEQRDGRRIDLVVPVKWREQLVELPGKVIRPRSLGIPACESDETMMTGSSTVPPHSTRIRRCLPRTAQLC